MIRPTPVAALALWLLALVAAGCPDDVEYIRVFPAGCEAEPVFLLLSPNPDGTAEIADGELDLSLDVGVFRVIDKLGQAPGTCEGHFHVRIDEGDVMMVTQDRETIDIHALADGVHTIRIAVHNNDHSRVAGIDEITATFTVDVETN